MYDPRLSMASLVHLYAERIDRGDFEGVAELLADADLTFEGHDVARHGRQPILDMYRSTTRRFEDGTPRTKHVVTNLIAELDPSPDTGAARSYFTVLQAVPDQLALQPIVAGRYLHRFRCVNGHWSITSMHIAVDLVGDVAHHLLIDL
jgi:hypothetical protein